MGKVLWWFDFDIGLGLIELKGTVGPFMEVCTLPNAILVFQDLLL